MLDIKFGYCTVLVTWPGKMKTAALVVYTMHWLSVGMGNRTFLVRFQHGMALELSAGQDSLRMIWAHQSPWQSTRLKMEIWTFLKGVWQSEYTCLQLPDRFCRIKTGILLRIIQQCGNWNSVFIKTSFCPSVLMSHNLAQLPGISFDITNDRKFVLKLSQQGK